MKCVSLCIQTAASDSGGRRCCPQRHTMETLEGHSPGQQLEKERKWVSLCLHKLWHHTAKDNGVALKAQRHRIETLEGVQWKHLKVIVLVNN